jgi:hypothetical protein
MVQKHRAAVDRVERLEVEVGTLRNPPAPPPSGAAAEAGRRSVELAEQIRLAQEANEQLRSFLAVFGPHSPGIGNNAG